MQRTRQIYRGTANRVHAKCVQTTTLDCGPCPRCNEEHTYIIRALQTMVAWLEVHIRGINKLTMVASWAYGKHYVHTKVELTVGRKECKSAEHGPCPMFCESKPKYGKLQPMVLNSMSNVILGDKLRLPLLAGVPTALHYVHTKGHYNRLCEQTCIYYCKPQRFPSGMHYLKQWVI